MNVIEKLDLPNFSVVMNQTNLNSSRYPILRLASWLSSRHLVIQSANHWRYDTNFLARFHLVILIRTVDRVVTSAIWTVRSIVITFANVIINIIAIITDCYYMKNFTQSHNFTVDWRRETIGGNNDAYCRSIGRHMAGLRQKENDRGRDRG